MSSVSSNIAHLQKLMESYISHMANNIGPFAMQAIQNHPYSNEVEQHNEGLVNMSPQIEQKVVLEFRRMAYLMAYLLRAYSQETTLSRLPGARANVEMLRAHEQIWPDVPVLQQAKASSEFFLQHTLNSIQIADAYVEQISAYAQENNDLASMEWYAKHGSMYLPRPLAMLNILFSARVKIEDLPSKTDEKVVKLREMGFHVTHEVDDWAPTGDVLLVESALDDARRLCQYVHVDDEQPSLDWVPNGIMEIRMASRL
ncbi:hypothetical protein MIMGU_mgv1a012252mg [Erythranthe guttata]|uniref:Uncharacterized protein n=1 Tax=Erythranthe guttata TaxID=4155 RepID=A0A022RF43_ERYGU|nr:PREDICTED: uncharacterized protein LOC105957957 [Erythranthe guttata]EYU37505.1 hypothetical protein MIMGU_mgv1a012252mg [Erythranthe guttata]|eukprot:XP_012837401.1 PREDICTED: uncharacterized protein LOC105957957 [Erythranthe guttata]